MNKFILLPYDIYKGLMTTPASGHYDNMNLEFAKQAVSKAKNESVKDPSAKNIHYNQELRRYLHLKKEFDDKPVKVDVSNYSKPSPSQHLPSPTRSIPASQYESMDEEDEADRQRQQQQSIKSTPRTSKKIGRVKLSDEEQGMYNTLLEIIETDPQKYGVEGTKIKNTRGRKITGSNLKNSLYCLVKGTKWKELTPPGTKHIEHNLLQNPLIKNIFEEKQSGSGVISRIGRGGEGEGKIQNKFKPKLWGQQEQQQKL